MSRMQWILLAATFAGFFGYGFAMGAPPFIARLNPRLLEAFGVASAATMFLGAAALALSFTKKR